MPFSRRYLLKNGQGQRKYLDRFRKCFLWVGLLLSLSFFISLIGTLPSAWAINENQPLHHSGDKEVWDRKKNIVELFGHASVSQEGETMTANYIRLDMNSRDMDAIGNCVYTTPESSIWSEEMHFNLNTKIGTVIRGRIVGTGYTLRGSKIDRLGQSRFKTRDGEYSTCQDCGPSWSLLAGEVDMEIDGYAKMYNVNTKIKDTPAFWLPYMVIPLKTRRQSGVLFPKFYVNDINGMSVVLPYFLAISRSADMTFGLGTFTKRGARAEWEGRYALTDRSTGTGSFFFLQDRIFGRNRWAIDVSQTQVLPWNIIEKLRLTQVSDNLYPFQFQRDLPNATAAAFLPTQFSLSRATSQWSSWISVAQYRNLLNSSTSDSWQQQIGVDPRTVQAMPTLEISTNDQFVAGFPLIGGVALGFSRFTRSAGPFDYDGSSVPFGTQSANPPPFNPGIDPLRKANRFSIRPTMYTTLRPFDILSVVPSVQYYGFFYNFNNFAPNLYRQYVLFQTDLVTQLEKIYRYPDAEGDIPRAKHLIRPILTYSYIPYTQSSNPNHPFLQQILNGQAVGTSGYNFDDNDIVPINITQTTANYFVPLGNSLQYGLLSQWIRRKGSLKDAFPTYQTTVELSANHAINFREFTQPLDPANPRPFARFNSTLKLNYDQFSSQTDYSYYTDNRTAPSRHTVTTSIGYVMERGVHDRVLAFDRSISLGYSFSKIIQPTSNLNLSISFSINDYFLPAGSVSYDLINKQVSAAGMSFQIQSSSRCWKFGTSVVYGAVTGFGWTGPNFLVNLTGSGFGSPGDIASSAVGR